MILVVSLAQLGVTFSSYETFNIIAKHCLAKVASYVAELL